MYEATIKEAFLQAYNKLIEDQDSVISSYDDIIPVLTNIIKLDEVVVSSEHNLLFKFRDGTELPLEI